ncbi:MarR family winged helix-turn-helix transcriptional regulator [Gordonia sp. NPDC003376]
MTDDPTRAYADVTEAILPADVWRDDIDASSIIWHMIRIAHRAENEIEFEVHRPLGWSWAGFRVMYNTFVHNTCEPAQLADILGVSRPTITSVLTRLERDGYITRTPSDENRRRVEVRLTESGESAVRQVLPLQVAAESRLLSALEPDKRRQLRTLLHELYVAMERDGHD